MGEHHRSVPWLLDCAGIVRLREKKHIRSTAEEECRKRRKGCGERGGSPCPRLSTQKSRARRALRTSPITSAIADDSTGSCRMCRCDLFTSIPEVCPGWV